MTKRLNENEFIENNENNENTVDDAPGNVESAATMEILLEHAKKKVVNFVFIK